MPSSPQIYGQRLHYLRQYSHYRDLRHIKALSWMITALICRGQLSPPKWESYVMSRASKAQSFERRWHRLFGNPLVQINQLYLLLVLLTLRQWEGRRLYLALDTTVLWNQSCMIHLSVVCCARAVPLLWRVLEHGSATVAVEEYRPLLHRARWLLRHYPNLMLLADRRFANHDLRA
jgi:hypothetical protein